MTRWLDQLQFGFTRKLHLILQTEATECGLASLAMVAGYHGYQTDLASLRARHAVSLKGATLAHLVKIAAALGLQARPVRLELQDLDKLNLPCILHWDLKHFVVLRRVGRERIDILDPARGKRSLGREEASRSFTGVALELSPGAEFQPKNERQQLRLGTLLGKVRGLRRSLLQVFALAAALEVFGLVLPFFSQWVIDEVLARALYKQPHILLLDEATSHLDTDTESLVNQAIQQLDMTRIVIAHRPQTIAAMGRVVVLGT